MNENADFSAYRKDRLVAKFMHFPVLQESVRWNNRFIRKKYTHTQKNSFSWSKFVFVVVGITVFFPILSQNFIPTTILIRNCVSRITFYNFNFFYNVIRDSLKIAFIYLFRKLKVGFFTVIRFIIAKSMIYILCVKTTSAKYVGVSLFSMYLRGNIDFSEF